MQVSTSYLQAQSYDAPHPKPCTTTLTRMDLLPHKGKLTALQHIQKNPNMKEIEWITKEKGKQDEEFPKLLH
jgi:hypothetical protein